MNVLVADYRNVRQKLMSMLLSELGCVHIPVYNGHEALDYLVNPSNPQPDIIFLQISMPVMGGMETFQILRTQPPFNTNPVLRATPIISCVAGLVLREECMREFHIDNAIRKPISRGQLKRMLLKWSRREFVPGVANGSGIGGFRPVWGPFPLRGHRGPRSLL